MDNELSLDDVLAFQKPRRTVWRDSTVLHSEVESHDKKIVEFSGRKFVAEISVVTTTTKHVSVREFDPENNYSDALQEFVKGDDGD
ncbi:MAG TPA: hypothetical protein VGE97_09460 [Nitrososphaera sp.]|jgi:hypothetical protein